MRTHALILLNKMLKQINKWTKNKTDVKVYKTNKSDWVRGTLQEFSNEGVIIQGHYKNGSSTTKIFIPIRQIESICEV